MFELSQRFYGLEARQNRSWGLVKRSYDLNIQDEFKYINKFSSPYIMKANKYFIFDPDDKKFSIYDNIDEVARRDVQYIPILDSDLTDKYKSSTVLSQDKYIAYFGGVIL